MSTAPTSAIDAARPQPWKTAELGRALVLLACMLLACAGAWLLTPTRKLADETGRIDLEQAVPKAFGDWKLDPSIIPINPSPVQQAALAQTYEQTVNRTYVDSRGRRVMFTLAYGGEQTNELRAHRQEVCYAAQGFNISHLEHLTISAAGKPIKATRMVATAGARIEPVTYWFTMGDEVVLSMMERQLVQLKYSLAGVIPDGYLVRISSIGSERERQYRLQQEFTDELFAALPDKLRRKLVGGI